MSKLEVHLATLSNLIRYLCQMKFYVKSNRILFFVMLCAIAFSTSGCFIFKKKCDCPSFGKRTEKSAERSS